MKTMIVTFSNEELAELLEVSVDSIKGMIRRGTLESRLIRKGYRLISSYKIGKYKAYDLQLLDLTQWELFQHGYKIQEKYREEHTSYSYCRLSSPSLPKGKLLKKSNMSSDSNSRKRAIKYDNILIAEQGIIQDKVEYALYNKEEDTYTQIDENRYKLFWSSFKLAKETKGIYKSKLNRKTICQEEYDRIVAIIENDVIQEAGCIAIKVKSFKAFKNNLKLLNMILEHKKEREVLR